MQNVIDKFLKQKQVSNNSITNNTFSSYQKDLNLFYKFLISKNIDNPKDIDKETIRNFYSSESFNSYIRIWKKRNGKISKSVTGSRSETSKNRIIATLSSFFKYMVHKKLIENSPLVKRLSKSNVDHQTLTIEEIEIIFKYLNSDNFYKFGSKTPIRDKVIIELLYYCGLRVSELINIKLIDLKFNNVNPHIIIMGKGAKYREQPVPSYKNVLKYIENERASILKGEKSNYLFVKFYKNKGEDSISFISRHSVIKIVKKICSEAFKNTKFTINRNGKVKYKSISPHMFRHSIGTHLHNDGNDIIEIRDFLGHSSVSTTDRYLDKVLEKKAILDNYGPFTGGETK